MRRLPGKYIVFAMLAAFLLIAVFVVVVAIGAWVTLAGHNPQLPSPSPAQTPAPAR